VGRVEVGEERLGEEVVGEAGHRAPIGAALAAGRRGGGRSDLPVRRM